MEIKQDTIEALLIRAEQYNKASLELLKLKSVDKTADIASTILSRSLLTITLSFVALSLTLGISFWLGELTGKTYLGFILVAIAYADIALALFCYHPMIKLKVENSIITAMLN